VGLDQQLLVLLGDLCGNPGDNLVGDVVDVSASLGSADAVHETDLVELAVTQARNDLPPLALLLYDLWQLLVLISLEIEVDVLTEVGNIDLLSV
jgi:hypothetical protein